ncbi:MAG TPA: hypothetical protein VJ508_15280, partial [Saprospiraceae bacterium]|nr:hypothetical protein [Saprospiraceae bacterium]
MKKTCFYLCFLTFLCFFTACKQTTGTAEQTTAETTEGKEEAESEHAASPVQLNNGSKWTANPETTSGINNMIQLVNAFPGSPSPADYATLREKLIGELNLILQRCTMTGEAHTQLHNYIIPLKDKIGMLNA